MKNVAPLQSLLSHCLVTVTGHSHSHRHHSANVSAPRLLVPVEVKVLAHPPPRAKIVPTRWRGHDGEEERKGVERDGKGRSTGTLVCSMNEGARYCMPHKQHTPHATRHTTHGITTMHGYIRVTVVPHNTPIHIHHIQHNARHGGTPPTMVQERGESSAILSTVTKPLPHYTTHT